MPRRSSIAGRFLLSVFLWNAGLSFLLFSPARAQSPSPFTEEAVVRGVNYSTVMPVESAGFGNALADLDNDGDLDLIVLGRSDGRVGLYENDGTGYFTDRSTGNGIPLLSDASGIIAGDYDGDGDLDLYFSNWLDENNLLRNDGSFSFTDVTVASRTNDRGRGTGSAWVDYDHDGWIDLYVTNNIPYSVFGDFPNRFFRNLGNGTFSDVLVDLGMGGDEGFGIQAVFFDYDHDGDSDLYLANGKCGAGFPANELWQNNGATFTDVSVSSGANSCIDSMGVAVGDFDGNGHQDLYPTNVPSGTPLHLNQGDGTFLEFSEEAGCASYETGWCAVFFDYDNDGFRELFVCNDAAPNRLYDHDGIWPSVDTAAALGVADSGPSYSVAVGDLDGDGDLDLVVTNTPGSVRIHINHEGEKRGWVRFDVVGQGNNRFAVGADVDIRTGTVWQIQEIIAGSNYKSQNELTLHFGIGSATIVDEVLVTWPGGPTRVLTNLPANETWTLYPPEALGDGDRDGDRDFDDLAAFHGCVGALQRGCEMMDFDGDAAVGTADLESFLAGYSGPSAGRIPGSVLSVASGGGDQIILNWGNSCVAGDTDFAIYEGALGDFSSHTPVACSTGGATGWQFQPAAGGTYYLVAPTNGAVQGSFGTDGAGMERPAGAAACLLQAMSSCD